MNNYKKVHQYINHKEKLAANLDWNTEHYVVFVISIDGEKSEIKPYLKYSEALVAYASILEGWGE